MFRRHTGFDTAYVGSSNLSRAALLDGVEWNVRLSRVATPSLLDKFHGTFDTYWNDTSFEPYDPDLDRDRLDDALAEASGHRQHDRVTIILSGLEVRPFPYQQQMLDELDVERDVHDRHRNLVVAATGTGKTVVAALDYRGLCGPTPADRPSLLFVAHRKEILEQSLRTYREVLADATFGELYVAGARPERWDHVFASVQSLQSYGVTNIPADTYDIVVIDEFHHAEAPTYRRLLDHLTPTRAARPHRDARARRRHRRPRRSSTVARPPSCGCGTPWATTCSARSTTSPSRTAPTFAAHQLEPGRYDEDELSTVYTGNHARAAIVLAAAARQGDRPWRDARARLLRQRRPRRVHGRRASTMPASRRSRSAVTRPRSNAPARARRPRDATSQRPFRRRPVQRGPRSARRRHGAVPPTHRERDDLPAAARSRTASYAATRPCSRSWTSSDTTARSSGSTRSCAP